MDIIINANRPEAPSDIVPGSSFQSFQPPLATLMTCLGFAEKTPPLADFLRQIHQLEGEWAVCEPIYWEASHNDAILMADARILQTSEQQSQALFKMVAEYLGPERLLLHYHNASTWLIRVDGKPKLNSQPTHSLLNRSMMSAIKGLDQGLYWQKIMTELQMFLKNSEPVSRPINGFWFYGGGHFQLKGDQRPMTDSEACLSVFPQQFRPLDLTRPFLKKDIVCIDVYREDAYDQILACIGNYPARWFWNNITYKTTAKSWWRKSLVHKWFNI